MVMNDLWGYREPDWRNADMDDYRVEALDGTTNALAFSDDGLFEPVYGPGSAERFAALGPSIRIDAPNLMDDVDTPADLARLAERLGPRTRHVLASLHLESAA